MNSTEKLKDLFGDLVEKAAETMTDEEFKAAQDAAAQIITRIVPPKTGG